ncbi:PfhR, partial [Pasteurella multocida subsp. multocida str. Anand1_buffalo]
MRYNKRKARAVIQERSRIHQHLLPQVRQNFSQERSFDGFKTKTISLKTEFNKSLGQHVVHELHYGLKLQYSQMQALRQTQSLNEQ